MNAKYTISIFWKFGADCDSSFWEILRNRLQVGENRENQIIRQFHKFVSKWRMERNEPILFVVLITRKVCLPTRKVRTKSKFSPQLLGNHVNTVFTGWKCTISQYAYISRGCQENVTSEIRTLMSWKYHHWKEHRKLRFECAIRFGKGCCSLFGPVFP